MINNVSYTARILFLLAIFVTCSFAYPDSKCSVIGIKKVLCRKTIDAGEYVAIYQLLYEGWWRGKAYYPESQGQTESVHVDKYEKFNLKDLCVGISLYALSDSSAFPSKEGTERINNNCKSKEDFFMEKIKLGESVEIPGFELSLGKSEHISSMYCMRSNYVRTYKYNKITQLETDRRDYHDIKRGTHCQDFLATEGLYWNP
jgi:hypothetical protein